MGAMAAAGVMVGGNAPMPPATTLRRVGASRHVEHGPFADTKEKLGGYVVIEVPDLDAALDWAAQAPCAAAGPVEVRPAMPPPA